MIPIHVSTKIGDKIEAEARDEILTFLCQSNLTVRLFSSEVEDSGLYIEELRKLKPMPAHHSRASGHIEVNIESDGEELKLLIGRDSSRQNEFWIFYPKHKHTELNEVGRIISDKILK